MIYRQFDLPKNFKNHPFENRSYNGDMPKVNNKNIVKHGLHRPILPAYDRINPIRLKLLQKRQETSQYIPISIVVFLIVCSTMMPLNIIFLIVLKQQKFSFSLKNTASCKKIKIFYFLISIRYRVLFWIS